MSDWDTSELDLVLGKTPSMDSLLKHLITSIFAPA